MRLILGLPLAALITTGLFLLMIALIATGRYSRPPDTEIVEIDFGLSKADTEVRRDNNLERPDQVDKQPPPPPMQLSKANIDASASVGIDFDGLGNPDVVGGLTQLDGDVTPLVRVPPQYPPNALSRGTEGWVQVEFDISETGAVLDPRVIDSDPPRTFDRYALRAVSQWKYKPRTVNGKGQIRKNVRVVISFELDQ